MITTFRKNLFLAEVQIMVNSWKYSLFGKNKKLGFDFPHFNLILFKTKIVSTFSKFIFAGGVGIMENGKWKVES